MAALIGLGLHGDAAPYSKRDSVHAISWNIVPQPQRWLIAVFPSRLQCPCGCHGKHTLDRLFDAIADSMRQCLQPKLLQGSSPSSSYVAAVLHVRGDWSWFKQVLGVVGWGGYEMCWRCCANTDARSRPWFDLTPQASWRSTVLNDTDMQARIFQKGPLSGLFSLPGFVVSMLKTDFLHTLDLGCAQEAIGSLFWEALVHFPGASQKDRVQGLWADVRAYYREVRPATQLVGLTLEMVKKPGSSAKLRAKGAETRYLVPYAARLASLHREDLHGETRYHCLTALAAYYHLVGSEGWDAQAAAGQIERRLLFYMALAQEAALNNVPAWRLKPKHHLLAHLALRGDRDLNPKWFWTYQDESWVGLLATLVKRRGGASSNLALDCLRRYRAAFKYKSEPHILSAARVSLHAVLANTFGAIGCPR
jgi:hypothetical protein